MGARLAGFLFLRFGLTNGISLFIAIAVILHALLVAGAYIMGGSFAGTVFLFMNAIFCVSEIAVIRFLGQ